MNTDWGLRFVNADELEKHGQAGGAALAAFVATWNRRCQTFAHEFRAFAADCDTGLLIVFVDVDECSALTAAFDVCSVPTTLYLRAGVEVFREVGGDIDSLRDRFSEMATAHHDRRPQRC